MARCCRVRPGADDALFHDSHALSLSSLTLYGSSATSAVLVVQRRFFWRSFNILRYPRRRADRCGGWRRLWRVCGVRWRTVATDGDRGAFAASGGAPEARSAVRSGYQWSVFGLRRWVVGTEPDKLGCSLLPAVQSQPASEQPNRNLGQLAGMGCGQCALFRDDDRPADDRVGHAKGDQWETAHNSEAAKLSKNCCLT